MNQPSAKLWSTAPAWRWLVSAAAICSVLALLGASRWLRTDTATQPFARFDPSQTVLNLPKTGTTGSIHPRSANTGNSNSSAGQGSGSGSEQDVLNTPGSGPVASAAARPVGHASAGTIPRTPSTVVWNNSSGFVSGAGLIAGYCCAGAYSTVVASTPVSAGKHYWELILSVRPGEQHPDTWTDAGVRIGTDSARIAHGRMRSEGSAIGWNRQRLHRNGDVFMFALDADSGIFSHGVNGQWTNGDPSTGGGTSLGQGRSMFTPYVNISASSGKSAPEGDRWIANFGKTAFKYPIPSGYSAYGTASGSYGAATGSAAPANSSSPWIGKIFEGRITLSGQTAPLPDGKWMGLAFFRGAPGSVNGDAVVLGRMENNRLVAMVAVNAFMHPDGVRTGHPSFPSCERQNYLFISKSSNEPFGEQRCWWVNHATQVWQQPILRAAESVIREHTDSLAQLWINVGFRRADEAGFITAFYYFNPEQARIESKASTWAESEWHRDRISLDSKRAEYAKQIQTWGTNWAPVFFATR